MRHERQLRAGCAHAGRVLVRDSKNPGGPALALPPATGDPSWPP
ncbi:MAG: DUF397 domain-containing protein [Pseudonocardiaceae bacterium]